MRHMLGMGNWAPEQKQNGSPFPSSFFSVTWPLHSTFDSS